MHRELACFGAHLCIVILFSFHARGQVDILEDKSYLVPPFTQQNSAELTQQVAVALSGSDLALIGMPNQNVGSDNGAGSAVLFHKENDNWVIVRIFNSTTDGCVTPDSGLQYAAAVSISPSGGHIVIGIPRAVGGLGLENAGRACLFGNTGGVSDWALATFPFQGNNGNQFFGSSICTGDTFSVIQSQTSRIYAYQWSPSPAILFDASNTIVGAESCAIPPNNEDMVVFGFPDESINFTQAGVVRVYPRLSNGTLSPIPTQELRPSFNPAFANQNFGRSIAFSQRGTMLAVGAPSAASSGFFASVQLFKREDTVWNSSFLPDAYVQPIEFGSRIGYSVGVIGEEILLAGTENTGEVYIFRRNPNTTNTSVNWALLQVATHPSLPFIDIPSGYGAVLAANFDRNVLVGSDLLEDTFQISSVPTFCDVLTVEQLEDVLNAGCDGNIIINGDFNNTEVINLGNETIIVGGELDLGGESNITIVPGSGTSVLVSGCTSLGGSLNIQVTNQELDEGEISVDVVSYDGCNGTDPGSFDDIVVVFPDGSRCEAAVEDENYGATDFSVTLDFTKCQSSNGEETQVEIIVGSVVGAVALLCVALFILCVVCSIPIMCTALLVSGAIGYVRRMAASSSLNMVTFEGDEGAIPGMEETVE